MSNAENASRKLLIELIAEGASVAKVLGGAVQFAILCGSEEEKRAARVADRAIRDAFDVE